jgi:hypothetical protein
MSNAAEKTQADLAHLIHPLYHPSDHQKPRIWVQGNGAMLKDMDGTEVIDGLSGLWNVNIGHGRRELAEAAMDQMSTLAYCSSYTGASNLPVIELAERLSQFTYPSINSFYFTSGGAESTDLVTLRGQFGAVFREAFLQLPYEVRRVIGHVDQMPVSLHLRQSRTDDGETTGEIFVQFDRVGRQR